MVSITMEHNIEIQKPVEILSQRSPRDKHCKDKHYKGKYRKGIYSPRYIKSPRKLKLENLPINNNDTVTDTVTDIVTDIVTDTDINIIIPNNPALIESSNTDSTNTDSTNTDSDNPESDNTDRSHISSSSDELYQEYQENINVNKPYIFTDIIDDKHLKYMDYYNGSKGPKELLGPLTPTLFWGIGIENESYLMVKKKLNNVANLKCKRERYSVDYFKSFHLYSLLIRISLDMSMAVSSLALNSARTVARSALILSVSFITTPLFTILKHPLCFRE
jgi:hypothetical protein